MHHGQTVELKIKTKRPRSVSKKHEVPIVIPKVVKGMSIVLFDRYSYERYISFTDRGSFFFTSFVIAVPTEQNNVHPIHVIGYQKLDLLHIQLQTVVQNT